MTKLNALRHEALYACNNRGHSMSRFSYYKDWTHITGIAHCTKCGMEVTIMTHPAPNHIEIGGEAVALDCK